MEREVKGRDWQPGLHSWGLFEMHKHCRKQIAGWDGLIIHPTEIIMIITLIQHLLNARCCLQCFPSLLLNHMKLLIFCPFLIC